MTAREFDQYGIFDKKYPARKITFSKNKL